MTNLGRRILIVAGGTGGHIYPALAVANRLKNHDVSTVWLGSRSGLETRIVPEEGIRIYRIAVSGLRGSRFWRWLIAPAALGFALIQAVIAVMRIQPVLVLGMGGFASGPGAVAAWICRKPLVIHEQNAVPGLTNSILSRIATKVLQGFPGAFPIERQAITVGNPIRESIVSIAPPELRTHEFDGFRILVLGGSQGAQTLNLRVPKALDLVCGANLEIWHQTGAGNDVTTRQAYEPAAALILVSEFIDNMAAAYLWADIVICRAGAMTVGELAAVGLASILVPFPLAVDDHQTANARYLVDSNAAMMVAEGPEFERRLATALQLFIDGQLDPLNFAKRARALATPTAATNVVEQCMELLDA